MARADLTDAQRAGLSRLRGKLRGDCEETARVLAWPVRRGPRATEQARLIEQELREDRAALEWLGEMLGNDNEA